MYGYPTGTDPNGMAVPYAQVLGRDHVVEVYCQVEDSEGNILSWQFGVEGGDVSVDRTAQFRRSCKIEVTPFGAAGVITDETVLEQLAESLIPRDGGDVFAPYGNQVRISYGIEVPGYVNSYLGNSMYVWGLGVFRLSSADVSDDGTPRLTITGYDHSRTISRQKRVEPWIVGAGTNVGDAIVSLCADRLPTLTSKPHTVTETMPQTVLDAEQDPWQAAVDWAAAIGCEVFFDRDGDLVIRDEPDPENDPIVWTYDDGTTNPNAVLLTVNRGMSDDPGYNGIILTSESNTFGAPFRVEFWDDDPSSPTYAQGPYGRVPYFKSSPLLVDTTQAAKMAYAELLRVMGGTETLDFAIIPNPAHEAGDLVRVVRPLSRTDTTSIIDSFSIPLSVTSPMNIRTRERRSAVQISGGLL